jgi:hypothetical protein
MGRNFRNSLNFPGQAASGQDSVRGCSSSGVTTLSRNEDQALWQGTKNSGGNGAGWGERLLIVARALGAQPAA